MTDDTQEQMTVSDHLAERTERAEREAAQMETKKKRKARLHKEGIERKEQTRLQARRTPRTVESIPAPEIDPSKRYNPSVIYNDLRSGLRLLHIYSRTHGHFYITLDSVTVDGDVVPLAEDAFFRVADLSWRIMQTESRYAGFQALASETKKIIIPPSTSKGHRKVPYVVRTIKTASRLLHLLVNDCYVVDCTSKAPAPADTRTPEEKETERRRKIAASRTGRAHTQATKDAIAKSLSIDADKVAQSAMETAAKLRAAQQAEHRAASIAADNARRQKIVESLMTDEGLTRLDAFRRLDAMEPKPVKQQPKSNFDWNAIQKRRMVTAA